MPSSATQATKLKNIIRLAQELLDVIDSDKPSRKSGRPANGGRVRRSGKELVAFRKMLKSERKKGARVEELAEKHGISTAYIYQLGA